MLGLGGAPIPDLPFNRPLPEACVLVPSDMIAAGEVAQYQPSDLPPYQPSFWFRIAGFGWPGGTTMHRLLSHKDPSALFCDGHVESSNPNTSPKKTYTNGYTEFFPDPAHARRWNHDNQPHPETWQNWPNPSGVSATASRVSPDVFTS